jgi:hypothetical protein
VAGDLEYTVPGLGSPNAPESSSVYVLDVSDPANPRHRSIVKTGPLVGERERRPGRDDDDREGRGRERSGDASELAAYSGSHPNSVVTVALISHSPCWKNNVIFVVEDDTQNGADHVDGHRSIFLAIGPWVKKQYVSKTHTSLASVFKTVNLILGLPPLNQYDAAATDLRDMFTGTPDFTPYNFQQIQFAQGASPV